MTQIDKIRAEIERLKKRIERKRDKAEFSKLYDYYIKNVTITDKLPDEYNKQTAS